MANPNFISNGQGERVDTLVDTSGTGYFKLGVGSKAITGASSNGAGNLVGTHVQAATVASGDPVVLAAGKDSAAAAQPLSVDSSGMLASNHATYVVSLTGIAPTSATELFVIEAPAGSDVRIRRIIIPNVGAQTTGAFVSLQLLRTTTAGTGGATTPAPLDPADSAYGGICRASPTPGTESTVLYTIPVWVPNTAAAMAPIVIDFDGLRGAKPPTIAAGVTHGIALKHPGAAGAASFAVTVEFTT